MTLLQLHQVASFQKKTLYSEKLIVVEWQMSNFLAILCREQFRFIEMMMKSTLYLTNTLSWILIVLAPLRHSILILIFSVDAPNTNLIIFGLKWPKDRTYDLLFSRWTCWSLLHQYSCDLIYTDELLNVHNQRLKTQILCSKPKNVYLLFFVLSHFLH